jgi:uncharacterized protein YprB with RNaseH-like and TPR domain
VTTQTETQARRERVERLRRLGLRRGARGVPPPPGPAAPEPVTEAGVLPGGPVDTPFGPAWVRTVRYPLAGRPDLAELLAVEPRALAAAGRDTGLEALEPLSAAFIDTETTGLAVGAGTYTFLIGIGTYEMPEGEQRDGAFVVRQFFMRNPGEERAQLHLVEEALGRCTGLVSFNGRAFDLPLVQSRFILARAPVPLAGAPHLDLLPPARRLWRGRHGSCALGNLERNVLGVQRTVEDVPGYLIPDIYREYYLTGVATEMLARVFYHNLQDVVSMVLLAARMGRLFRADDILQEIAALHPLECLSLAYCYEALGWTDAGIMAYRAALGGSSDTGKRAEVLRALGFLYKRLGRLDEAAALWEEWIGTVAGDDLTPYVELAKHHEWRTADLAAARGWAAWALRIAEGWSPSAWRDAAVSELQHRLARLERKLSATGTVSQREDAP